MLKKMLVSGLIVSGLMSTGLMANDFKLPNWSASSEHFEVDADLYIASLQMGSRTDGYKNHKIESQAGVGVTFDFRGEVKDKVSGLSPLMTLSYYADGRGNPLFTYGIGLREREYFKEQYFWEVSLCGVANIGAKYDTDGNKLHSNWMSTSPILSFGIGYQITKNNLLKTNIAFIPKNNNTREPEHLLASVSYSF